MIAIVDYGMGNLQSVQNGFARMGYKTFVTDLPEDVRRAEGIILPGVGAFGQAVVNLKEKGLGEAVKRRAGEGAPLLGICLGLQLLLESSQESSQEKGGGLGLMPGKVIRFQGDLKIPHMGWNRLKIVKEDPLLKGITNGDYFYFVHSYYAQPEEGEKVLGLVEYGKEVPAVVRGEPLIYGVQFHPEKSSQKGLKILANFGELVEKWK
ncbi:MAG: imidazole glycerol phosphate synthase subunit HisH [Candidatus Syntrophonatronum acetioxidans]|uniref:Imidazole glycerol phosphate synthase subunit HisH n=1 Tax=Candidatus Syntrophonatronum acetioxidans TaxID=1795816 RepID=A0A424YBA9_9FIRM|nr:MAG: imidazole glycerol phosphate synthase subunit HisH [Candidatus Syntrophonatronum acetioxidans]